MPIDPIDHAVSKYAIGVVEGDIIAGDLVRMACERHLLDLETGADRGLKFDCEKADMIINFAGLLKHTKGQHAGDPLMLQPWQVFRHGSVFGWVHESTGHRRFRQTYHQIGKKNGKTTDTASPMLYSQLFDGEAAPEGYCAATTRDQAGILFKEMKRMVAKSPFLSQMMNCWVASIETPRTDGAIKCVSRESDSIDGVMPHFLARDEMHRWTDRELAETLVESALGSDRAQPIDWVITTAGHDRLGLCGEMRTYAESVLRGGVTDDAFFAYVAEPAQNCDPADPVNWRMGNPNLGVSKPEDYMQAAVKKAFAIAGQMPNFKRFHLNLWTDTADAWIDADGWNAGLMGAPFDEKKLYGRDAWVAIDLSQTTDTTAIAVAVPVDGLIYVLVYTFLPEGKSGFIKRAQSEKREYIGWRDDGWLEVHKGGTIDQAALLARMKELRQRFNIREIAYDPWSMSDLVRDMDNLRWPLVQHRQGFASMSVPMKEVEALVVNKELRHGGNPVLAWQVGNVYRDEDAAGNVKPNKRKSTGRIDAAVAMMMAVGRAKAGLSVRAKPRETEVL